MAFLKTPILALFVVFFVSCGTVPTNPHDQTGWDRSRFPRRVDGLLFYAVRNRSYGDVRELLSRRNPPNTNVSDRLGQSVLMWASWNGDLNIVRALLGHNPQRGRQRLDTSVVSGLGYNALFAFVMSDNIDPQTEDARSILKDMIRRDPGILRLTDYYGETIFHKLARSNWQNAFNNYFEIITGFMDNDKRQELLNLESRRGFSPLELAVELATRSDEAGMGTSRRDTLWLIDALINEIGNGITINDLYPGENRNHRLAVTAFNSGAGNLQAFIRIFRGKMMSDSVSDSTFTRDNEAFVAAYRSVLHIADREFSANRTLFIQIYNWYVGGAVFDPRYLYPPAFYDARDRIFYLARGRMDDAAIRREFFDRLRYDFPIARHMSIVDTRDNRQRPLLQFVIENPHVDIRTFEYFFSQIVLHELPLLGNGFGDYLNVAMVSRRKDIMHSLLARFPSYVPHISNLMSIHRGLAPDIAQEFMGQPWMDVLHLFMTDAYLASDRLLLHRMARFYAPQLQHNVEREHLLIRLFNPGHERFDVFEHLLRLRSRYFEGFHRIEDVRMDDEYIPILEILFANNQQVSIRYIVEYHIAITRGLSTGNRRVLEDMIGGELWLAYKETLEVTPDEDEEPYEQT
ncbi:MAG: ankyrin repeat domain-containing protein [Treponema sp.]|nr:ankyrin repeat domain-containing protein [Treponema sp.]